MSSHGWIYFALKVTKARRHERPTTTNPQDLISFLRTCPAVMQFCMGGGAAPAHIVCLSETFLCKWLQGCSLDTVYYCSAMCHGCQRGPGYIIWILTDGFLQTCAICRGDLSDFRCNNCQRNEGAEREAISSDGDNITLWSRRKQRERNETKYQILRDNGSQMAE